MSVRSKQQRLIAVGLAPPLALVLLHELVCTIRGAVSCLVKTSELDLDIVQSTASMAMVVTNSCLYPVLHRRVPCLREGRR